MDLSFILQLGIAVALLALIAFPAFSFARRAARFGPAPVITASSRELQTGWYQIQIAIANQTPYGLHLHALRRVRPRAARLLAPIKSVSTRSGAFQVWTHPSTDKATTSFPLDLNIGPREDRGSASAPNGEGHVTAWLLLPENRDPAAIVLELAFVDRHERVRRYRVTPSRESMPMPHGHAPTLPRRGRASGV